MWEALKICLPITLMTFAIFTRSDMVINPGWLQIIDTFLVAASTCGIAYAMFGRFADNPAIDIGYRLLTAAMSLVTMFHPNDTLVKYTVIVVLALLILGVWRHAKIASPKGSIVREKEEPVDTSVDLAQLATEAKREV
jgi:hypothetical protein